MITSLQRLLPAFLPFAVASDVYRPVRVEYDALGTTSAWVETLRSEGLVSIQNVPGFGQKKFPALRALASCIQKSPDVQELRLEDGTVRTTLAGHAKGPAIGSLGYADGACPELQEEATTEFRNLVGQASVVLANGLMEVLDLKTPLLRDQASDEGYDLAQIVLQGEQLEHFHVYRKSQESEYSNETIEWHVDQGLFLLFTPGLINGETVDDFYIQRPDGSTAQVQFDTVQDDLILLLGDGVNQYLNNNPVLLKRPLRAVPHTIRMVANEAERVWYGRMVLPPPQSIHPSNGETFGFIREEMMKGENSLLGCSSSMKARELQDVTCDPLTAMYCWHRCMNFTDYNVSADLCAADGLDFACGNDNGDLWNGDHDPQFKLTCVDSETAVVFGESRASDMWGIWSVLGAIVGVALALL